MSSLSDMLPLLAQAQLQGGPEVNGVAETNFFLRYWRDGLTILILWVICYHIYTYFRATRGARIFSGLMGIWIALTVISQFLDLVIISWLLKSFSVFLALGLVVIFQPELRRALAEIGSHRFFSGLTSEGARAVTEKMCDIAVDLGRKRIGALIAVQRAIDLKQYLETGVALDCRLSPELVITIFHPGTPLHDGGIILRLRDERILGAACVFPLSQRELSGKGIGLRHRAAMGITDESDAVAIIVSEETGGISLAHMGQLERELTREQLAERLHALLFADDFTEDEERHEHDKAARSA